MCYASTKLNYGVIIDFYNYSWRNNMMKIKCTSIVLGVTFCIGNFCIGNYAVASESLNVSGSVEQQSPLTFNNDYAPYGDNNDRQLRGLLRHNNISPVRAPEARAPALVALGRNLFFEKEVSGRRNVSCSTCHNPLAGSADGQSQSRGQGALGLAGHRRPNGNEFFKFLPRNTLSLWNRGAPEWTVMFWDGRLGGTPKTGFFSPADPYTPQNFSNALAAFSIVPLTPDEEMRGFPGQRDVFGNVNEMSELTNADFPVIWPLVTARVTNHPAYDKLLADAFPGLPKNAINISHIAEAIGAFMQEAFTALDSPFDRYLAGDNDAMSVRQKRGAILFYGKANCVSCHAGGLQTDFGFHNIAGPQVGTGRGDAAPLDLGRGAINRVVADNFKFRTPSLRNIELEFPYFHNGAYAKLEDAVTHHFNPAKALANYDASQIEPELAGMFQNDAVTIQKLLSTLSPKLYVTAKPLPRRDLKDLMSFMSALTDPSSLNLNGLIPDKLPSGLTLAD
jgi:cytochrome c peroxidase